MRKFLLFTSLLMGTVFLTTLIHAQNDRFAFAVTDLQQTGSGWNVLRKLDLRNGEYSNILLNGTDLTVPVFDATTKNSFKVIQDAKYGKNMRMWTSVQGSKDKGRKAACTVCGKQETLYVISR